MEGGGKWTSGAIAIQLHVIQNVTYGEEAVVSTFF